MAEPATNMSAPAFAMAPMLSAFTPPSISSRSIRYDTAAPAAASSLTVVCGTPLRLRAGRLALRAWLLHLRDRHHAAQRMLHRALRAADGSGAPLLTFEITHLHARILRALRHEDEQHEGALDDAGKRGVQLQHDRQLNASDVERRKEERNDFKSLRLTSAPPAIAEIVLHF